ncbi:hypothetical protein GC173_04925 [bacterium]|nr:hypothetical protein [bacterium]
MVLAAFGWARLESLFFALSPVSADCHGPARKRHSGSPPLLKIGMLVFPKGLIAPQVYRVADTLGPAVELKPITLGGVPTQSPVNELRRYRLRTTDEVTWGDQVVTILRIVNPQDADFYRYEIEDELGGNQIVTEAELQIHEGSLSPEPATMLAQGDLAPWELTRARVDLLDAYFKTTARSLGLLGYLGARMLPIPHQINAARYAIQFARMRFLLADEVGLGKTVEAGLIVATLRKYFSDWQTAVFVPESLAAQWAFEMYGKFGKLIYALSEDDFDEDEDGIILPHERIASFAESHQPEIIVVDEAHRVLRDPEMVAALTKLSRNAHAVLLLTATPVSDDVGNLLKLLHILDPEAFAKITTADKLRDLQSRAGKVEAVLQAIRKAAPDHDEILSAWKATGLRDGEIEQHLADAGEDELGRHDLHRMAALITDRYYPGARILRYRRKFLAQDNALPFRVVDTLPYRASGEESAAIQLADEWFDLLKDAGLSTDPRAQQVAGALFQATFSSPLALADWLAMREGDTEEEERPTADPILLARRAFLGLDPLDGEEEWLDRARELTTKWQRATRSLDAQGRALARTPRYAALLAFLKAALAEEPDGHVLVFTAFEANVHPLYLLLRKALDGVAEVYEMCGRQPRLEREKNAFEFQEFPSGSVLISDELGGEGRNFQFCSHVVHFDLPPAPWTVEQRIGRCDRVGRDEELDVDSQVIVAEGHLDEAIFQFLAEGVGVFNDSIAPIEGELDTVVQDMMTRLIEEGSEGILDRIEEVAEQLEAARERENADLLVRSAVGVQEARRIASELRDDEELLHLREATIRYARLFDSMVDEQASKRVAFTVGEFHSLSAMPGILPEMIGLFDRKEAVRHERLDFFSPGHPLVRALASTSMVDSPDRTAVVRRRGLRKAAVVFNFRVSIPAEFFHFVRSLEADLRPPLLSRSASLFGTRMYRLALDIEGNPIPNTPANAAYFQLYGPEDTDLSESSTVLRALPEGWAETAEELAAIAQEQAEDFAASLHEKRFSEFEDLVCEVIARVRSASNDPEEEVASITEKLTELSVDLDAVWVLLPAK